jgi:hypothetical protein
MVSRSVVRWATSPGRSEVVNPHAATTDLALPLQVLRQSVFPTDFVSVSLLSKLAAKRNTNELQEIHHGTN